MNVEKLQAIDLAGKPVKVVSGEETKCFRCLERAGAQRSQKGVVWKALDSYENPSAIKFVARDEYRKHSLSAEMKQSRHLSSRFAQITAYGDIRTSDKSLNVLESDAYAIVVEWVEGQTFEEFCSQQATGLDVATFLQLASELCEALALLNREGLCHNDLHERNIMVVEQRVGPHLELESHLKIIDTGSLMTLERRKSLLEKWSSDLALIGSTAPSASADQHRLKGWIDWFSRDDQEWVVLHLVTLLNLLRQNQGALRGAERRFLAEVTPLLSCMLDPDHTRRLDDPAAMHQELEMLWKRLLAPPQQGLMTPFDFISAELIRSDSQLNDLFSDKCPWFERCATTDPIYIYGPRGCGKSTILRKLSLPAVLASREARSIFEKCPYVGVYLSCTAELRSRFWLFPPESYPKIKADVILFFSILLTESLLDTFELLRDGVVESSLGTSVGLTHETAREICRIVCEHFGLPKAEAKLSGLSWLKYARKKLEIKRDAVWQQILGKPSSRPPDPSVLFDLCKDLEAVFPLLRQKHISFLVDDYSNQRIPFELQRMLNQTISFAKQGNPIFKVSSEYQGVDLEGIQQGREVVEVNLGKEYVDLADRRRSEFLEDVVNIRFAQADIPMTVDKLLGRSGISPAVPMARAIREASLAGGKFYYHGIDTVADICSGDLAMALDLVKQIYMQVKHHPPLSAPVSAKEQHEAIHGCADREHMYLRYFANYGKEISAIIDALCWLARESALRCDSVKDKRSEPMVKTHLDIALAAVGRLPPELHKVLQEMQKKGVLFSLDTSRSRIANRGTERFQVRRILLVKYLAPLGRRDPIKLDDEHKLIHLLQEPKNFAAEELSRQTTFRI
jgi:serine/threonine protein kinase